MIWIYVIYIIEVIPKGNKMEFKMENKATTDLKELLKVWNHNIKTLDRVIKN